MPAIGTKFGPYEILEALGSGGMGEVYRARDPRIGRDVAIKFISSSLVTTKERLQRFEHEVRTIGSLNHPNILGVYDVGTSDGSPYFVTELLEGETLRHRLASGPIPVRKVIDYSIQISEGLAAAHRKGIVHRDLKPENIFITKDGRLKILDFGLAKLMRPETSSVNLSEQETISRITDAGFILGTVAYMSPEQIRGNELDHRSDLFAFGIIFYEILSGKRPFTGNSNIETMNAVIQNDPPDIYPQISPALKRILERCLEKEPSLRFQSASDLTFALQSISTSANDIVILKGSRILTRKTGMIVAVSIVAVLMSFLLLRPKPVSDIRPQIKSLAVLPLENLNRDAKQEYFSDGMTEALITELAKIKALKVISSASMMQYKQSKKSVHEIARELRVDAIVQGSVMRSEDRVRITARVIHGPTDVHLWAESYERDLQDILTLQKEVAHSIADEIRISVTSQEFANLKKRHQVNPKAYDSYLIGRYSFYGGNPAQRSAGISYLQKAIEIDPNFALGYVVLASASLEMAGGQAPFRKQIAKSKALVRRALEIDDTLPEAHATLGELYGAEFKWSEGEKEIKRSLELNPNCSDCYWAYSAFLRVLNRLDEAIIMNKRAKELDPLTPGVRSHLAWLYLCTNRYDEMAAECKAAQDLNANFVCWPQAIGYTLQGHCDNALVLLKRFQTQPDEEAINMTNTAWIYGMCGKRKQSLDILNNLLLKSTDTYIDPLKVAIIYAGLRDTERTVEWLKKASDEGIFSGYLGTSPHFEPIRSDPRFNELLRRAGLPQ